MEFLKRNLTQIQATLGEMSFTTKWLIGSLLVILILVGSMLVLWGGAADMVPVDGLATGSVTESAAVLTADGIDAKVDGGQLMVPGDQLHEAVASLSRAGHLNPNASAAFDQIMTQTRGDWTLTSTEKDRNYLLAKGQFLSAVIGSFPNVESASVILDKPEANGFGVSHIDPSASVMVTMQPGTRVSRQMADTLIHMVSSAVAGLNEQNVTISDTTNSRSFTAADPDEIDTLGNIEATLASERLHKQRIEDVLSAWEGAMVAVKIVTNPIQREEVQETAYAEPAISQSQNEEITERNVANAGAPGASSNTGSSIEGNGAAGTERNEIRRTESFNEPGVTRRSVQRIAGNTIRRINVSVVVPRSHYVRIYQRQNPEAEGDPTDAELEDIIAGEEMKIQGLVTPQIVASEGEMEPGDISIEMVYDQAYLEPQQAGVASGLGAVMSSDLTYTGVVGALGVASLCMMFYMLRRATRRDDLPSVEELAGVPATLPTEDDLMGEVDEMDGGLAGVELDEDELRARQIAEQISDLVRSNPEEAGGLLTKWVVDDRG